MLKLNDCQLFSLLYKDCFHSSSVCVFSYKFQEKLIYVYKSLAAFNRNCIKPIDQHLWEDEYLFCVRPSNPRTWSVSLFIQTFDLFNKHIEFSAYRYCTPLKFLSKWLIFFSVIINGIVFLLLISTYSLLVYRPVFDFFVLTLCPATLLDSLISFSVFFL